MLTRTLGATILGAALSLSLCGTADAVMIQADIRAELGFDPADARVFESLGASIGAGTELDLSHETANPAGWVGGVLVDIDPAALTVAVTGADPFFNFPLDGLNTADFEFVNVFITNIVFDGPETVSGLSVLMNNLVVDAWGYGFTFEAEFTANSISLRWFNTGAEIYVHDGQSTVVSFATTRTTPDPVPVPVPPALSLFAAGLVGIGLLRRRARRPE